MTGSQFDKKLEVIRGILVKTMTVVRGIIVETFRLKRSSAYGTDVSGLIAIILTITFVISILISMAGFGEIPRALERVVDIMLGYVFGSGHVRYNNRVKTVDSSPEQ